VCSQRIVRMGVTRRVPGGLRHSQDSFVIDTEVSVGVLFPHTCGGPSAQEGGMTAHEVFGERLRRRRMALGWSQVEFARRVEMWPTAISRYEGGTYKSISFVHLRTFATVLHTSCDYLVGLTDDAGPVPTAAE